MYSLPPPLVSDWLSWELNDIHVQIHVQLAALPWSLTGSAGSSTIYMYRYMYNFRV